MKVTDLASVVAPNAKQEVVGVRPGEKLHEQMIGIEDAPFTFEYDGYYKILPAINNWNNDKDRIKDGIKVEENFIYESGTNKDWMTSDQLETWIKANKNSLGKI
jgi:FlaA1/EpsC-like NDP-sugar epimerase